jgi:orotate phosphoribosyltransferase
MKVAFSPLPAVSVKDLEHAIAQVPDADLIDAQGVVIRAAAELWIELAREQSAARLELLGCLDEIEKRSAGLSVYILPDAHDICELGPGKAPGGSELAALRIEYKNRAAPPVAPAGEQVTSAIRQTSLDGTLRSQLSRCVVEASRNHHFILPSGAHSSLFIRLAEACVDLLTVDQFAYWIAQEVCRKDPGCHTADFVLVVDHPSMLALGLRVARFFEGRVDVKALRSYATDVQTRTETINTLSSLDSERVILVIGIASTGRLARFVAECAAAAGRSAPTTLIMFAAQDIDGVPVLCRLHLRDYKHSAPDQDCPLCAAGSQPVRISGSTYLVGYQPGESAALPAPRFKAQKAFLERYGGHAGVLRVHFDDPNEYVPRHHAFYIDVSSLMKIEEFRQEFGKCLREMEPRPDVVIAPAHPAAETISTFAAGVLQCARISFVSSLRKALNEEDLVRRMQAAQTVLVLDDVFITGTRLDGINRSLREEGQDVCPHVSRVHFFTLLATPASQARYVQRKGGLTGTHAWQAGLSHLYEVPLPDWHDKEKCPWCRESRLLSRIAQANALMEGPLIDRLSRLRSSKTGIDSDPYFVPFDGVDVPLLGSQSAVLGSDSTPMQVLLACASAIQQQRHAEQRPLAAERYPAPTFLAERVLSTNYTERSIWLAILRGLRAHELEPELKDFLRGVAMEVTAQSPDRFIAGELGLAWLNGTFGEIPNDQRAREFFEALGVDWETLVKLGFVPR